MAINKISNIPFKRKIEGKTNYKKRLTLLKSRKPRIVIRKFNKNIVAQLVEYSPDGDIVRTQVNSSALEKFGWNYSKSNTPSAYLTGLLLASKAKEKEAILDVGLQSVSKDSKIMACLKGCVDGGINVPYSKESIPSDDRIKGVHIANYSKTSNEHHFSGYKSKKVDPSLIGQTFEDVKKKIMSAK